MPNSSNETPTVITAELISIINLALNGAFQVADSYSLSASRARTNDELALLGAALIG
jgi:hypothetical protein